MSALEKGTLDVIVAVAQTEERENLIDFSNTYYTSGSAIAVPVQGAGSSWARFVLSFFSRDFLSIILILILLWLIAGSCVFLFESRRNQAMFGGGIMRGLGQGIW